MRSINMQLKMTPRNMIYQVDEVWMIIKVGFHNRSKESRVEA